jgi:transposase-like protein
MSMSEVRRHVACPHCGGDITALAKKPRRPSVRTDANRQATLRSRKLTDEQVRELRARKTGLRVLARRFGICEATAFRAREGFTYRDVT